MVGWLQMEDEKLHSKPSKEMESVEQFTCFYHRNSMEGNFKGRSRVRTTYNIPPTILFLKDEDGTLIQGDKVKDEIVRFYGKLFSPEKKNERTTILEDVTLNQISKDGCDLCEGEYVIDEIDMAVQSLNRNKSPGYDGFTLEFYLCFWDLLRTTLFNVFLEVLKDGRLEGVMAVGVVCLIQKKGDPQQISNWRPITLMSVDLKIFCKIISNRLKMVIPEVVAEWQTAIPSRTIHMNLIIIRDIISWAHRFDKQLVVLSLDQRKAFDRVNHTFLFDVIKKMGFGPSFTKAISTVYSGYSIVVKNGRDLTPEISFLRGVRQGDPLSSLLYAIALEPVLTLATNKLMEWAFTIPGRGGDIPMLWTAYADDITFFLRDPSAVEKVFQVFGELSKISEASINIEKSSALVVRNTQNVRPEQDTVSDVSSPITCLKDSIRILGITFLVDGQLIASKQFQDIYTGISTQLSKNFNRLISMSYLDRARWINSRIWPRWLYVLKCLHPTKQQVHLIQNQMLDILWMGGKHWLNLSTVCRPIEEGGLSLVDVECKLAAIRTSTIIRVMSLNPSSVQMELAKSFLGEYGAANLGFALFCVNPETQHLAELSEIYKATVLSWQTYRIYYNPRDIGALLDMPVATNKFLEQATKPVRISIAQAEEKGVHTIRDLINLPVQRTRFWKTAKLDASAAIEEWVEENVNWNGQSLIESQTVTENPTVIQIDEDPHFQRNNHSCSAICKTSVGVSWRVNECEKKCEGVRNVFCGVTDLIADMSIMTDWDKFEGLNQMTSKSLYVISSKDRGAETLRCCQDVEKTAWTVTFSILSPPAHNNCQWQFLHGRDLSQDLLIKIRGGESQLCPMCGGFNYSREHTYSGCSIVRPLRANVWAMLDELGFSPTKQEEEQLYKGENKEELLANFLLKAFRYTVTLLLRRTEEIKRPNGEKLKSTFFQILKRHLRILIERKPLSDSVNFLYWAVWTCRNVISLKKEGQLYVRCVDGTFDLV